MSKSFPFTQKGLEDCLSHKDYIGIAKEKIENHPELFVLALTLTVGGISVLLSPAASAIAFKSGAIDISEVAFKYVNGGF